MKRKNIILLALLAVVALVWSCNDKDIDDNYYAATKQTAAQKLQTNPETYSLFCDVLQRSNCMSLLSTYGTFTVFAPTNDAMNRYLRECGYSSIDQIPNDKLDTLAYTHIIKNDAYFTTDIGEGALPQMNMDDRYIDIASSSNENGELVYVVNGKSNIIERDDSCTNGVVHTIDRVLVSSGFFLPDLIENDSLCTIFGQALKLTGLGNLISASEDESYTIDEDSVRYGVVLNFGGNKYQMKYPERRYYKYTAFVETDSVFREYGINSLDDLIAKAKEVYDQVYPGDAGTYDGNYRDRRNPLNRFIAYHLLDRIMNYNNFCSTGEIRDYYCRLDIADPEDYYETMCPHTIIRVCAPASGLYINRKGLKESASVRGVKILTSTETANLTSYSHQARNGVYHFIDRPLYYDVRTRDVVLNRRIRIDGTTLSPDFMNAGVARVKFTQTTVTGFKNGFITNWKTSPETTIGVRGDEIWTVSYEGNMICIKGMYDVSIKIPPVPAGTYEVRLGFSKGVGRGMLQAYIRDEANGIDEPCGIPLDAGFSDQTGFQDDTDDPDYNLAIDKAMHNLGYMKSMDSQGGGQDAAPFRATSYILRRILCVKNLEEGHTYWLRLRQIMKDPELHYSFDYIELCPKSVYASAAGEDTH